MKKQTVSFYNLLWRSGFVVTVGGLVAIDKHRACEYLHCSMRTLERWIKDDKPCPRAVALLEHLPRLIPDEWTAAKFHRGKLVVEQYPYGLTLDDINYFGLTHSESEKNKNDTDLAKQLVEQHIDREGHALVKKQILSLANDLNALAKDPIFDVLKLSPKKLNSI